MIGYAGAVLRIVCIIFDVCCFTIPQTKVTMHGPVQVLQIYRILREKRKILLLAHQKILFQRQAVK